MFDWTTVIMEKGALDGAQIKMEMKCDEMGARHSYYE